MPNNRPSNCSAYKTANLQVIQQKMDSKTLHKTLTDAWKEKNPASSIDAMKSTKLKQIVSRFTVYVNKLLGGKNLPISSSQDRSTICETASVLVEKQNQLALEESVKRPKVFKKTSKENSFVVSTALSANTINSKIRKLKHLSNSKKKFTPKNLHVQITQDSLITARLKADFLENFHLQSSDTVRVHEKFNFTSNRSLKLFQCPNVPISSNLGRALILRENQVMSKDMIERKLDKTEFYINRIDMPKRDFNFRVTYDPRRKGNHYHVYKFLNWKQLRQKERFLLKFCKPFSVKLTNDNLVDLKSFYDKKSVNNDKKELVVKLKRLNDFSR